MKEITLLFFCFKIFVKNGNGAIPRPPATIIASSKSSSMLNGFPSGPMMSIFSPGFISAKIFVPFPVMLKIICILSSTTLAMLNGLLKSGSK